MKSLQGMSHSTVGGDGVAVVEVTTSLPERYLGAIEGRKKLSEFETKKMKRLNL